MDVISVEILLLTMQAVMVFALNALFGGSSMGKVRTNEKIVMYLHVTTKAIKITSPSSP